MGYFRSAADRLYRRLVRFYPQDFRAEYGEEMTGLFRDRSREEPLLPLLISVFLDTLKTAPKEHFSMWSQDLRYAARTMLRNPGFTLIAAGSLAIGIGANAAIFSLADALLLRPLAVARPAELVAVRTSEGGLFGGGGYSNVSYLDYVDLRDRSRSFEGLVAFNTITATLGREADTLPHRTMGLAVSANFFPVLGVDTEIGRVFRSDEDEAPGRNPVAILSHATWQSAFGGEHDVLGKTVRLNGIPLTVVGVASARFKGMDQFVRPEVFVPLAMVPAILGPSGDRLLTERDSRGLSVRGRLRSGVSLAQADVELSTLAKNLEQAHPETNRNQGMSARTDFQARVENSPPDAALTAILMTLVALVLLIACANVASLLLSRSGARAREIAVRLAVGAGRARLVRQLLTESLLLALLGGVLGLGVAYAGVRFFSGLTIPTDLPIALTVQLDGRVLGFSLAASVVSVFLFGLTPALRATRADLVTSLKAGGAGVGRGRFWGRRTLVAAQVALSLVLLGAATGLVRGFGDTLRADVGFRKTGLLLATFDPTLQRVPPDETRAFYRALLDRVHSLPGVTSAALANAIPLSIQLHQVNFLPEGFVLREGQSSLSSLGAVIDPAYFSVMGVPLVTGRGFAETDTAEARRVAIVNEEVARKYWPGQDPIGKRLQLDSAQGPWAEIVGVARTHKYLWVGEAPADFVYLPWKQNEQQRMTLLLQSSGDAGQLATPLRELVRSVGPAVVMHDVRTMEELYRMRAVNLPNMIVQAVGSMGALGLALALVGLYGLMASSVSRRTREIGIRMAIGADRDAVVRMVLRQGLVLTGLGLAAGLVASVGVSRLLAAAIHGFAPIDPFALIVLPAALLAVATLAILAPARRAARIEPVAALRQE